MDRSGVPRSRAGRPAASTAKSSNQSIRSRSARCVLRNAQVCRQDGSGRGKHRRIAQRAAGDPQMEIEQLSGGPVSPSLIAVVVREQPPKLRWGTHRREDLAQSSVIVRVEGRSGLPRIVLVSLWRRGRHRTALTPGTVDEEQKRAGQTAQSQKVSAGPSPRPLVPCLSSVHRVLDTRTRTRRLITNSSSHRVCDSLAPVE